jgi:hypothetical protein
MVALASSARAVDFSMLDAALIKTSPNPFVVTCHLYDTLCRYADCGSTENLLQIQNFLLKASIFSMQIES